MGRKKLIWLCNCRYKDRCFLADECLVKCIVYKAEVTTTELSNYLWNISNKRFQYETKRNTLHILQLTSAVLRGVIYVPQKSRKSREKISYC